MLANRQPSPSEIKILLALYRGGEDTRDVWRACVRLDLYNSTVDEDLLTLHAFFGGLQICAAAL